MAAEDLPSSRQFWVVCGGFISAGSGKHALRRQNRERAHVNGNNNITGVDLGRGGVLWLRRFLGRGRNGMWIGQLALFGSAFLAYVEPKLFFFFRAGKFWSAAPIHKNCTTMRTRSHKHTKHE